MNHLIIIAILSGLLLFAGYKLNEATSAKAVADASVVTLTDQLAQSRLRNESDRLIIKARDASIVALTRDFREADFRLKQALEANPNWSNTHVPNIVQDALVWGSNGFGGPIVRPQTPIAPSPSTGHSSNSDGGVFIDFSNSDSGGGF